jgi:hypothetical protein
MSQYTTTTNLTFSSEHKANEFVHLLDEAENEDVWNDYGPGWFGNILHMLGLLDAGICESNGVVMSVDIDKNFVTIESESVRGPQLGPLTLLANVVDESVKIEFISFSEYGEALTNTNLVKVPNVSIVELNDVTGIINLKRTIRLCQERLG